MLSSKSPRVRVGMEVVCHRRENPCELPSRAQMAVELRGILRRQRAAPQDDRTVGGPVTSERSILRTPFRASGNVKVKGVLRRQRTAPQDDNVSSLVCGLPLRLRWFFFADPLANFEF